MSLEEVNKINPKKTITGAIKGISYEDIINLKVTAEKVNESNKKLKQATQAEQRAEKILSEAKKLPMKKQMEQITLLKENEDFKKG